MKIKFSIIFWLITVVLSATSVNASGYFHGRADPLRKTFIKNPKQLPDPVYQKALLEQTFWQKFIQDNGTWYVMFNENSGMPHRAYGKPVAVPGFDIKSTADNFISNHLRDLNLPVGNLNFRSISSGSKYHYVNYIQYYQGLEVLFTHVQVKMMHDYRVNQFALDCYQNISLSTSPGINDFAAAQFALNQVPGVQQVTVNPDLKILPVPGDRNYNFHLVYDVMVENIDAEGIPGKYYTLVDANTGEILYRSNKVHHIANTDINVTGTMYLTHPYNPATVEPMKNMRIVVGGNTFFTDDSGNLLLSNTTNTTATFSLQGRWVRVRTNNVTPSWVVNLTPGANNILLDSGITNIKQRTTYNAIDTVHGYMKSKFPSFTGLDFPMTANIDVGGTCNAFYDGSSVNFFDEGNGCNASSLVADVCYHEYGHAINHEFYDSMGMNFENGAMHEGYADLWALGITTSPILGIGFFSTSSVGFVRRYDINKKVYPQNLIGESHADGEIIAGCFWDTGINLGNLQQMMDLFKETYYAGITGPDGSEGSIFPDILLETLLLDDNDGDFTNGTPNYCPIVAAFELHGITISMPPIQCAPLANFTYTPNVICEGSTVAFHDGSSFAGSWNWSFPGGTPSSSPDKDPVITYNTAGVYDVTLTITNAVGTDTRTEASIITVLPGTGQYSIPFTESFESITFPGTEWSIENNGGATWSQNTLAAKTGANSVYIDNFNGNPQGTMDVFYTPTYNLTGISNAIMTFELAYALTDSISADRLKVYASTNCGQLWNVRYVKTGTSLAPSGVMTSPFIPALNEWSMQTVNFNSVSYNNKPNVQFKFEYVHDVGNNMFIDDINITGTVGMNEVFAQSLEFSVYPNPVSSGATVSFILEHPGDVSIDVLDVLGREVNQVTESKLGAGEYQFQLPIDLSNGVYNVRITFDGNVFSKKIVISKLN